jgi:hypothetical protein
MLTVPHTVALLEKIDALALAVIARLTGIALSGPLYAEQHMHLKAGLETARDVRAIVDVERRRLQPAATFTRPKES